MSGTPYKLNIYSILEIKEGESLESKELHEKIVQVQVSGIW